MAGAGDDDFHRIAALRDLAEMKARPLWQALETASSRAARAALPTGRQTNGGRSTETIGFDASAMQSVDNRQSRFPFLALKLGLSLLVVAVIYEHGIFATAWRQFTHVDPGLVLLAVVLGLFQTALGALRWKNILILLGARLSTREALQLFYIAVFFNTYVWGGVGGDVLRGWLAYRTGTAPADAIHSVILDRIAAVAGVALLMLFTIPWFALRTESDAMLRFLSVGGAGILAAIALVSQLDRLPEKWHRLRAVRLLLGLGKATRRTLFSIGALSVLAAAILSQMAFALGTYSLAWALGIEIGVLDCLALMPPVALLIALPISLGGWGVREAAMIALFGAINVAASKALLLSVCLGLVAQVVALPGGVMWLFWREVSSPLDTARS
jgi:uncharacterized membrane protein YbhN (UPF0104 family)